MPSSNRAAPEDHGPTLAGHGPGPLSPGGACTGIAFRRTPGRSGGSDRTVHAGSDRTVPAGSDRTVIDHRGPDAAQVIGAFPPSTITVTPVTYLASSDSRKRTTGPMSSTGSPR